MTYEMYRYIFVGALIAGSLFFVLAGVLFFTLRIPQVISDLTGRTARRAIEDIRTHNERTGGKTYQSSAVNLGRGKITDKISKSGRLVSREDSPFGTGVITEELSAQQSDPMGETDVLTPVEQPVGAFTVEYEITFIHTNEVIA